jgi:hypothetical protein
MIVIFFSAAWSSAATRSWRSISPGRAGLGGTVRTALATVDPTPYFARYGNNAWAAVKTYLEAVADYAAAPVITKYTGVLAAADVFTASNAFIILESIRLDLGYGSQIHP